MNKKIKLRIINFIAGLKWNTMELLSAIYFAYGYTFPYNIYQQSLISFIASALYETNIFSIDLLKIFCVFHENFPYYMN